jgi:hypothetical protein
MLTVQDCINSMCRYCADGAFLWRDATTPVWMHGPGTFCAAAPIHERINELAKEEAERQQESLEVQDGVEQESDADW